MTIEISRRGEMKLEKFIDMWKVEISIWKTHSLCWVEGFNYVRFWPICLHIASPSLVVSSWEKKNCTSLLYLYSTQVSSCIKEIEKRCTPLGFSGAEKKLFAYRGPSGGFWGWKIYLHTSGPSLGFSGVENLFAHRWSISGFSGVEKKYLHTAGPSGRGGSG